MSPPVSSEKASLCEIAARLRSAALPGPLATDPELIAGNGSPVMNDVRFDTYGLDAALGHDSVSEIGAES